MIRYTYDGWDVIREDSSLKGVTTYQNGLGIDDKLRSKNGTTVRYFLTDHLGSTVALADASGAIVSSTSYDSFGNSTSNISTSYRYTGREYDSEAGLYYYRNRWYDPEIGRFISKDPIGFAGGDINLYGYVGSNPLSFTDPYGNYACRKGQDPKQETDCEAFVRRTQKAIDFIKGDNFMHLSPREKAQSLLHTLVYNFIGVKEKAIGNKPEVKFNINSGDDLRIASGTSNNEYKATGFKSEFVDTSNQVRHFTGGLWAGYLYGSMGGYFGMNSNEENRTGSGTGAANSGLGILPTLFPTKESAPDIRLNAISTKLGGNLRVGVFSHLARKIKEKVCK